jgi:hypothetical protein
MEQPKSIYVRELNHANGKKLGQGIIQVFALTKADSNQDLSAASDELVELIRKHESEIDLGAVIKGMMQEK